MSRAAQVLAELAAHGIRVRVDGDRLALSPSTALTPELRTRTLAHKRELLAMLEPKRAAPVTSGLAIREVNSFTASLLPELPIPTTLVLHVPALSMPVMVATHDGNPRRTFSTAEWRTMIAYTAVGIASPAIFRAWCLGEGRGQMAATAPVECDPCVTVARVLGAFGCKLRAVVLEGGAR